MDNSVDTKKQFRELMNGLSEYYEKKEALKAPTLMLYFSSLADYDLDQISEAITRHIQDADAGRFYPKVADLLKHLRGHTQVKPDEIIGMARVPQCPLGVLARIHIGSHDLDHRDHWYLVDRAQEVIQQIETWKTRAQSGAYSDHEISMMIKLEVDPKGPFSPGALPPSQTVCLALTQRVNQVTQSERHQYFLEPANTGEVDKNQGIHPDIAKRLKQIVGGES